MSDVIDKEWDNLYTCNPKIQAFAVCDGPNVVWQTSNWNLVKDIKKLFEAPSTAAPKVKANGIEYTKVTSNDTSYIASAKKNQGHFIMVQVENDIWVMAWAKAGSIPELTLIDLSKTAVALQNQL
ncbi:MAG: hypothetical protein ACW97A_12965 [Candidatus Thorarchaeota archaeon]|jgi:hypothetical protein